MNDLLVRFTADLILGVTWVIAWEQILYADDLPGDGFTAGVFLLVAILLQYVVLGHREAALVLPRAVFHGAAVGGLAMLVMLFVAPLFWGNEPLRHFYVSLLAFELSSTTLFDLAIFLAIGGGLVAGLTSIPAPDSRDAQNTPPPSGAPPQEVPHA